MTYFINGGNSGAGTPYIGAIVGDAVNALTFLRNEILGSGEGWVIGDVDDIAGTGQFSVDGTDTNDNKVRILFTKGTRSTPGFADEYIHIRIRDLDASGTLTGAILTSYSPNDYHRVQLDSSGSNLLYAALEKDGITICTIPASGFASGVFAGMVERIDNTDKTAIYIGYTNVFGYVSNSVSTVNTAIRDYMANTFIFTAVAPSDNSQWTSVARAFSDLGVQDIDEAANTGTISISAADPLGVQNLYANTGMYTTLAADNASYGAHIGSVNSYNGKPLILPYFITEGIANNVQHNLGSPKYCKGIVKNVIKGLSYMVTGGQWESTTGEVYLSTGEPGWMGMRIA